MPSLLLFLPLFIFSLLPLSSAAICASQECNHFHICYPFSLDSNKSCEGLSSYGLQCQNGTLLINDHIVTDIDYSKKQISVKESDCPKFEENWEKFLEQVPDANASKVTCDKILIIHWNLDSDPVCKGTKKSKAAVIVGSCVGGSIGVILVIGIVVCVWFYRKRAKSTAETGGWGLPLASQISEQGNHTPGFSYKELEKATASFAESRLLGIGGFGMVYEGRLKDGQIVAVKRLNRFHTQCIQQFRAEIQMLSRAVHPNLVLLLGYCEYRGEFLLIYEFIANGTLEDHLHGEYKDKLDWFTRIKVAYEIAQALEYLHFKVKPPIFHRDVKSANILLDSNFHAKLADFGLSRDVALGQTHISTAPQGTPGYLDPAYHQYYQLTDKSDVYSFGVVLMELISGKVAVDLSRDKRDINLAAMAVERLLKGGFEEIIDPDLRVSQSERVEEMVKVVGELGMRCLAPEREDRPNMQQVAQELQALIENGYGAECVKELYSPDSVHYFWPSGSSNASSAPFSHE